MVLTTLQGQLL